jgi:HYR domain
MPPTVLLQVALRLRVVRSSRAAWRAVALLGTLPALTGVDAVASAQQLTAGTNVNMVGGPASITLGPPIHILGDPYLQRQNEPSIACSSRNPLNCLASANDYRLVDVPGVPDGKVTGDAWLGVFWSRDGGLSWRSTVLPGFPQDTTPEGLAFPLHGRDAAADPVVRAGTGGLMYLSGIAFNRTAVTDDDKRDGDEGTTGGVFASLFIDDNNAQTIDTPIRYVRSVLVDDSEDGIFLDKPWIAVDIPRAGAGTCTIPGGGGAPDQTVPAGNVYIVYAKFHGTGSTAPSDVLFRRSTDCGQTWSAPLKLYDSTTTIGQGATLSVNPQTGEVLVAWREFGTTTPAQNGRIMVATSTDFGQHFTTGAPVVDLGPADATSIAFDQGTLPTTLLPNYRMFRTNGYPTTCIDTAGVYHMAWSQRGVGMLYGDARIMTATSSDGLSWGPATPIDNYPGPGHQLMPAITCNATTATVVWYDQRSDAAGFGPQIFDVINPLSAPHTLDVRAAQTNGAGGFSASASIGVSRYQYAYDTGTNSLVQLEFNPVNWPLFAGGTVPFLGDYVDIAPATSFVPAPGAGGWAYFSDAAETPVLHAAWTDNRDIAKALLDDWVNWAPPGTAGCSASTQASTRNQNIYTSRLSRGIVVGVEGNSRPVGPVQRAFAAFVQNTDVVTRRVRLTTGQLPWGAASFLSSGPLGQIDADVPAGGTIARTVFVDVTSQGLPVILQAVEVDASGAPVPGGATGTAFINADPTAPPPADVSVVTGEVHTPTISDAVVNTYPNPTFINPTFINPTFINPTFINPTFVNPTFVNPTFVNPTFVNPTFVNPTFINQTFANPTFVNQPLTTDLSWQVVNTGNVATGYNFSALLAQVPAGAAYQLIINRIYSTPGANGCTLGEQFNADIQSVVNAPPTAAVASGGNPTSPDVGHATFALAASEMAVVTLRISHDASTIITGQSASAVVASQPANSDGSSAVAVFDTTPPSIAVTGGTTAEATGPAGAVVNYTVSATDLVDGVVTPTCSPAAGTTFAIGATPVTCSASDAHGNLGTLSFTVTVQDTTPPVIAAHADLTVPATSAAGAVVAYVPPSAVDAVSGTVAATCLPASGSVFAIGTTPVVCSASDAAGNAAVPTSFNVTVTNLGPTVVSIFAAPPVLWIEDGRTVPVVVAGRVTNPAGIASAAYSVHDDYGQITTSGPVRLFLGGYYLLGVNLVASRLSSDLVGRHYTITVTGISRTGVAGSASAVVIVPRDHR